MRAFQIVLLITLFCTFVTCAMRLNDPGLYEQEIDGPINFGHLPPDVKEYIMENQILTAKDRANFVINREMREAFKHQAPLLFASEFGCNSIDKLHQYKKSEDYEFSNAVINAMPVECISHRINLYAGLRKWDKVELIIKCGADPNLLAYSMRRALSHGWSDDVRILQRFGLDPSIMPPVDIHKLNRMLVEENIPQTLFPFEIRLPLQTIGPRTLDKLLLMACHNELFDLIHMLIEFGADVLSYDSDGVTPLHYSAWARDGSLDVVVQLLKAGAAVNIKDYSGYSPFHRAVTFGYIDIVEELIIYGAYVNIRDNHGQAPLHIAAMWDQPEMVEELISAGALVDIQNNIGQTPLYSAASWGRTGVIKILVSHGAELNIRSNAGQTPLHIAASNGQTSTIRHLILAGVKLDVQNKWGETPLYCAAREGFVEIVDQLLENGADKSIKNSKGETALDIAKTNQYYDVVRRLKCNYAADKNIKDKEWRGCLPRFFKIFRNA